MSRGHSIRVRCRAVELFALYGPSEVATIVEDELGVRVDPRTIGRWAKPEREERRRVQQRSARRRQYAESAGGSLGHAAATVEAKFARLLKLAEIGLGHTDVARVLSLDFGDVVSPYEVRQALATGRPPRKWLTAGEGER